VVEVEPRNSLAKGKIPELERACQERMEKLKEETLGAFDAGCLVIRSRGGSDGRLSHIAS